MKRILILLLMLCAAGFLGAQENLFIGLGPEVNSYTDFGMSVGGNLILGIGVNSQFATGLRIGYYYDDNFFQTMGPVGVLEPRAFFRYYLHDLPWFYIPEPLMDGPFVQAELGGMVAFEAKRVIPWVTGGVSIGWRFNLFRNWYVEPEVRVGYPLIWGVSAMVGYKFPLSGSR